MATLPSGWTRWFHCESSFDLSLVPQAPGLIAVGREEAAGRQLDILQVEDSDDLFHTLNQLFSASSGLRQQFGNAQFMIRYAHVPDAIERRATIAVLRTWLAGP